MKMCSARTRCRFGTGVSARYGYVYTYGFYFGMTAEGRSHRSLTEQFSQEFQQRSGGPGAARFFSRRPIMIIVMQPDAGPDQIEAVEAKIRAHGLQVHVSRGTERTLIGAVGDERALEPEMFDPMPGVEKSMHIVKQYKMVAREWHKDNTIIDVAGIPIGGSTCLLYTSP